MSARSGQLQGAKLAPRDVRGTEREKTGTGKKLERTRFFPFPFLQNFDQRTSLVYVAYGVAFVAGITGAGWRCPKTYARK